MRSPSLSNGTFEIEGNKPENHCTAQISGTSSLGITVRRIIRESVIRALAAAGEWPIRVDVVTSKGSDDGRTKRWFVEYETGPYGQVIDQPDQCG
jgi:hypothetical protein